jgi:peroxiredoxin
MQTITASPERPRRWSPVSIQGAAFLFLSALVCQSCGNGGNVTSLDGANNAPPSSSGPSTQTYFLGRQVGPGIAASPAQDASYKEGTVLKYSFVGTDTGAKVLVTQDGKSVPASGTVTMDQAHVFTATIDNQPGSHAPEFSGLTADGQSVKLSDYRGRYVFVDFSEMSCPGSVNQASYLQSHSAAFKARGMDIITVLVFGPMGQVAATPSDLVTWQHAYGLSFPVITDRDSATAIYNHGIVANTTDFPSGYIVDDKGIIRAKFIGFDGPTIDAALAVLFP